MGVDYPCTGSHRNVRLWVFNTKPQYQSGYCSMFMVFRFALRMDLPKNVKRRRQYLSKTRRRRVEAALRRWGKSLSPVETINSSPFQENATLFPMETVDSVSSPPFEEVMSHADSEVAGTLGDHPMGDPESINLASSLSGEASSVIHAPACLCSESGTDNLEESSSSPLESSKKRLSLTTTTIESSDINIVVPPSAQGSQIGGTFSWTDSSPVTETDPQSTVSAAQGIDSTCETTIERNAIVVSCRQEASAVHSDCVVEGHLESSGMQWDGASLSHNSQHCAVVDGSSELNNSVVPCDIVPQSELDVLDTEDPSNRESERLDSTFETIPCSDLDYSPPNVKPICDLGKKVFLCATSQVQDLIDKFNCITKCTETPGCPGKLVPTSVVDRGLGGTLRIKFQCSCCGLREIDFNSSPDIPLDRYRSPLGTALQVAFICAGCMYTQYFRTLCLSMGMSTVGHNRFFKTIQLMYPHVENILKMQCEEGKKRMKSLDDEKLGSFKNAVTTGDAAYLTTGHFSRNSTYTVRNKLTNEVLYYTHMCQRGYDHGMVEYPLFKGTSNAMEGHAAEALFEQAFKEGMHIAVHWQDADSSSAKAFRKFYPDKQASKNMYCVNHVVRNHIKALNNYHSKKSFSKEFIKSAEKRFPQILDPKNQRCHCGNKHRRDDCGCLKPAYHNTSARINFRSALIQSGNCPETFRKRMLTLPHHARDDHSQCEFHRTLLCSCGKCGGKVMDCSGRDYHTKHPITCPMHSLAYEIECHHRSQQAEKLIHPVLGMGYTNQNEASHNVFIRYRSKSFHLERLHYILSTNLGLLQSNMTPNYELKGPGYHWILELFESLNLPLFDGMEEAILRSNHSRMKQIEKSRSKQAKTERIKRRHISEHEQAERKRWNKQQSIVHTYGEQDSSKRCRCGSTTHLRTTSKECRLNKSKQHSESMQVENVSDGSSSGENPVDMLSEGSGDDIVESSENEDKTWCICEMGGSAYGTMVECCNSSCTVKWFHLRCMSLTTAPKGAWYCSSQCEKSGNQKRRGAPSGNLEQDSGRHCRCGSTSHLRTTSRDCPFNKKQNKLKNLSSSDESDSEISGYLFSTDCNGEKSGDQDKRKRRAAPSGSGGHCRCGSTSHLRITSRNCPFNKKLSKDDEVVYDTENCSHFSEDSGDEILESSGNESELWCICQEGGSLYGEMIECCNEQCEIKWFHLHCMSLDVAPKGDWFCSDECEVQAKEDVVIVEKVEKEVFVVSGPLPTEEWKSEAIAKVQLLSKCSDIQKRSERIHKLSCPSIAPHTRVNILADGHCFFRALAFAITGSQEDHKAVRLAIVNFCLHPENVSCLSATFGLGVGSYDPIDLMSKYIKENGMDKCGWATTSEILAAATLFQVRIYISTRVGGRDRHWARYKPLFHNTTCMAPNDFKVYIYHTDSEDHYDFVMPQLDP